jgi:hypothetical protein
LPGKNGYNNSAGVQTVYSNIAPRFGFAFTPVPGFVIRGGYGLSYAPTTTQGPSALKNQPFLANWSITNPTYGVPTVTLQSDRPQPAFTGDISVPTGSFSAISFDLMPVYLQQYNITVQKDFSGNVLSVGYVGALGRHEGTALNVNQPLPGPGDIQKRRPYYSRMPAVTTISLLGSQGGSSYHGLQVVFERRYANGLAFNTNYTWAHAIGTPAAWSGTGSVPAQLPWTNLRMERGNRDQDIRHRWVLMANYELPFWKSLTGFGRHVMAGWQVNAITMWSSGAPFTVTNNSPRSNQGITDRPDRIGSGKLDNPSIAQWFDTSAFVPQAIYTVGNSAVNILSGPPVRKVDFSLFKGFRLTEVYTLTFRVECFNITNTPSFGAPNGALGSPGFGSISDTGTSQPRQIQLALKLAF